MPVKFLILMLFIPLYYTLHRNARISDLSHHILYATAESIPVPYTENHTWFIYQAPLCPSSSLPFCLFPDKDTRKIIVSPLHLKKRTWLTKAHAWINSVILYSALGSLSHFGLLYNLQYSLLRSTLVFPIVFPPPEFWCCSGSADPSKAKERWWTGNSPALAT